MSGIKILYSDRTDPWLNLAVEHYLLDSVLPDQILLYIWQNKNTVVIGRNQNAWRECAAELLEQEGGKLARRLSGGGAVYHDLGNLNYTFVAGKSLYDVNKQYTVLLDAVRALGIPAEMTGRNDLVVDGRKFSGNAFCNRKNGSYHHGTLLVSVDMDKLSRYLRVSTEKMKAKGVQSVRSRVVNLTEYVPSLTVRDVADSLKESFEKHYGKAGEVITGFDGFPQDTLRELYNRYSSWEWLYGEAPPFDFSFFEKFSWGEIQFHFELEGGLIRRAFVYSDAMDEEFILRQKACFTEKRLKISDLTEHIKERFPEPELKEQVTDIMRLLQSRDL
jgi:lipoate-protein ligase A